MAGNRKHRRKTDAQDNTVLFPEGTEQRMIPKGKLEILSHTKKSFMMIPMSVNPVTGRAMDVEYMFRGIKYCPELLSISPEVLESIEKTSMEYASLMCFRNRAVCRLTIYAASIHNLRIT